MPVCKISNTATKSVVKLRWSKALEKQRRGFSVEARSGIDAVMSCIECEGGHKKASFVASLNPNGTVQIKRKFLGIFNFKRQETVAQDEFFPSSLKGFFQFTQLPRNY